MKYIFLGLLQGITEVLPISSSGHHQIASTILNISDDSITLSVMLHIASLFAVVIFLRKEIKDLLLGFFKYFKNKNEYRFQFRLVLYLFLSTFILVVFTLVIKALGYKSSPLWLVGVCLLINAFMLSVFGKLNGNRKLECLNTKDAIVIGLFQCIGSFPGISRSGSCLCGCNVRNIDKDACKKYSFLLFIPAILGGLVLELNNLKGMIFDQNYYLYLISFIVSGITTYFAFEVLNKIIKKGKFTNFSIYCIILGMGVILYSIIN